jgi:hypothetical protein
MNKKKRTKKKGRGMSKGSDFERKICKRLSLWWSGNRDDIFWRTAGSGARATTRSKQRKQTYGEYGDVKANDPEGEPLLKLMTIEIKRGYSSESFANLIEWTEHPAAKPPLYFQFIQQAEKEAEQAGTYGWMIIAKRDKRTPIIIIPYRIYNLLRKVLPSYFYARIVTGYGGDHASIYITTLEWVFDIDPEVIKQAYRRVKNG